MDLNIEALENIEAPLSNDFWAGFAIGVGTAATVAGIAALFIT